MTHESLLVISARGESIGTIIHYNGDETFVVEQGKVFPTDFELHHEGSTVVCEDGALAFTLSEYCEEPVAKEAPPAAATGLPKREHGD
jgi:hypothetical protein